MEEENAKMLALFIQENSDLIHIIINIVPPDSEESRVPVHVSGSILWEDGVRGRFDCAFDTCFRQRLAVAGSIGEFSLSDFVIAEDYKYVVECNSGVLDDLTKVGVTIVV